MQTCDMTNRVYVVRPLCPSIPYIKSKVGRNGNHHIIAFCNFRWPLLCSCSLVHFSGLLYKYFSRNRFPDIMLYMSAVAKIAVTSKFDLSCRPLPAQRARMANTRDAPTNLMSEDCMEQCTGRVRWV